VSFPERRTGLKTTLLLKVSAGLGVAALLAGAGLAAYVSFVIRDLFRLNRMCRQEGYYMAEFEFKMLGLAYLLDKGRYFEALQ